MKWSDSKDRMAAEEERGVVKVAQYEGISGDVVGLKEPLTPGIRFAVFAFSSHSLLQVLSLRDPLYIVHRTTIMTEQVLETYQGNCHCGAFKFSVRLPELKQVFGCNCSICSKVFVLFHSWGGMP